MPNFNDTYMFGNRGVGYIEKTGDLASQNVGGQKQLLAFGRLNVTTNLNAVVVPPLGGNSTLSEIIVDRPGSIIGIAARLNADITAGTIDVFPTIDGTTAMKVTLSDLVQVTSLTQDKDIDTFASRARLGVKLTSSANLAPTTGDIIISLIVEI